MPHRRPRLLKDTLLKRLKHWPIVGLLGARQTGKSVLLRDIISNEIPSKYRTLDINRDRSLAESAPDSFAEDGLATSKTLVIDEVQKVPPLFDSIKAVVDRDRRPGMFLLSGSSEFSSKSGIHESLTGRIGLLHLYPLTLAELFQVKSGAFWDKPFVNKVVISWKSSPETSIDEFQLAIDHGGMPGMCFIRDEDQWQSACQLWTETTCTRDLARLKNMKKDFDGDLAVAILAAIAQCEEPTALQAAKKVRKDRRVVQRYLEGFCAIFVLERLSPNAAGVGESHYLLLDPGLASYLEAPLEVRLHCHLLKEALAHLGKLGFSRPRIEYYRNARTSRVPILLTWPKTRDAPLNLAIHFNPTDSFPKTELAALKAFQKRVPEEKYRTMIFNMGNGFDKIDGVEIIPFRA